MYFRYKVKFYMTVNQFALLQVHLNKEKGRERAKYLALKFNNNAHV